MNNTYFTEEHNLFRKSLSDFLQKEVVPHIDKWEKNRNHRTFYLGEIWGNGVLWNQLS